MKRESCCFPDIMPSIRSMLCGLLCVQSTRLLSSPSAEDPVKSLHDRDSTLSGLAVLAFITVQPIQSRNYAHTVLIVSRSLKLCYKIILAAGRCT